MSLKQRFVNQLKKSLSPTVSTGKKQEFGSVDYTIPQLPCVIDDKKDPWVWYGEDNLYPFAISDLRAGSGIHNSIINTKKNMTAGNGWLINGAKTEEESNAYITALPSAVKSEFEFLMNNPFNDETLLEIKEKCADDFQTFGAFSYEVVLNTEMNKISRVKYVNVENIRSGKLENGEVKQYWHSRDWGYYSKKRIAGYRPTDIYKFDPKDKEHMNQIVYVKKGKGDYYGDIPYKGCLNWIMVDFKMGLFHLSNIDNGMNPGMWFKFYKLPADDNEKQAIINDIKKAYRGALNANKFVTTFSESKEVAMDIQPIQASNLDKMLLQLAELSDKKILTGHQLTSPLLAGISVSGSLGGNTELQTAFKIFDSISMASDRAKVDASFQKLFDYNNVPVKIKTNPWNPFI